MTEWFYAKGGQQTGPVTFDQLRELAGSGELDAEKDMVWKSTLPDWMPAGQVQGLYVAKPALAAAAAVDPSNPYASPQSSMTEAAPSPGAGLPEIIPGSEPIDVMACVKRGFELTKRQFGIIVLVGLTYIGVSLGAAFIFGLIDSALGFGGQVTQQYSQFGDSGMTTSYQRTGGPFSNIIGNVLSIFLSLGVSRIGLNLVSGKEVSVGALFGQGGNLLRGIGASILFGLMFVVGLLLLVIPGIYVAMRYGQFMNAIVDRNMGVMDALSYSSSITENNRMNLFVLALMTIAIFIAGCLALLVGLIFAWPVIWLSWAVAYRWMQYGHRATEDHPGTATPMLTGV